MKTYDLKVKFVFTGTVQVRAENKIHALIIANDSFGMVAGNISTNNESSNEDEAGAKDWDIDTHPTDTIIK